MKKLLNLWKKGLFLSFIVTLLIGCTPEFSTDAPEPVPNSITEHTETPDRHSQFPVEPLEILDEIPEYSGEPFTPVNGNIPFFTDSEKATEPFETYSDLDNLGRCQTAYANICRELMPTEERSAIGHIRPSGWHTVKYDCIPDRYLYNRCHLIGYQLSGENDNEKNLITGTRYLNVEGMLPFENQVAEYVHETGHHVLYRVTPLFRDNNLLADGVLMEAESVEDNRISFNVFVYNRQPGVIIDYASGDSRQEPAAGSVQTKADYILNTSSKKIHRKDCSSVKGMSEKNKQKYSGSLDVLLQQGYTPCGSCNP